MIHRRRTHLPGSLSVEDGSQFTEFQELGLTKGAQMWARHSRPFGRRRSGPESSSPDVYAQARDAKKLFGRKRFDGQKDVEGLIAALPDEIVHFSQWSGRTGGRGPRKK